ncbi:MAG: hypothetical protein ISS32_01180 [Candidatus Omnitrophica bacterium]|nr:hypothetical protein [Candidatus Omnitrophota bacterium]MBL7210381.1 hypothetical protein [Candidatus Omnitrophota bacterium]
MPTKDARQERRQYIRLDSVFPVQFQILSLDRERSLSGCLQGFTNNVGKGGICLAVNNLTPALSEPLKERKAVIALEIQMPMAARSVKATAKVAWIESVSDCPNSYLIGLSYEKIDPVANSRLMRYARAKKLVIPLLTGIIIILGLGFGLNSYISAKLIKGNRELVVQLVGLVQRSSIAKQKIKTINKEREDLQVKLKAVELQIRTAEEESIKSASKKRESALLVEELNRQKESLQEELIAIQTKEAVITEDLLQLDKIKTTLEEANLEKMYKWLQSRQNLRSGLLVSIEGKSEAQNQALTYEQALAAQAYTNFSDFERARMVFNFFNKRLQSLSGLFPSVYYVSSGKPLEGPWQTGPNITLGIAAVHYTQKTKNRHYLPLAEEIAARIMRLQQQDREGGIPSAEEALYYCAKDNLDAYALFNMLHKATGEEKYQEAGSKTLNWLLNNIYDKNGIRPLPAKVNIDTDTFAWAIAAIGPVKLEELGVNPDRVIEFAENNCGVKTCYIRPGGQSVDLKGFDFSVPGGSGASGIVSSERTAQMVIAFKIIADFYYEKGMIAKARAYASKIGEYLSELDNLIISSPSPYSQGESCLPYANQDIPETIGASTIIRSKSAGSLAGTVYTLFAYYNYNPLEL